MIINTNENKSIKAQKSNDIILRLEFLTDF